MQSESGPKILVSAGTKVGQNTRSPSKPTPKPVSTTEKQSMAYLTVRNIQNETSFIEADCTLFILKELTDNAWDWLNDYYPVINPDTKSIRKIGVRL